MVSSGRWVSVPEVHYHQGYGRLKHALANLMAPVSICAGLLENENPESEVVGLLTKSVHQMRTNLDRYDALLRKTPVETRLITCEELAQGRINLAKADGQRILSLNLPVTLTYIIQELETNDIKSLRLTFDHQFSSENVPWVAIISEPKDEILSVDFANSIGVPYSLKNIGLGLALVVAYTYRQSGKVYFNTLTSELAVLFPEFPSA